MMSAKLATLGLLKKGILKYDVIISVHDVSNRILLCDLNCIVDAKRRPKSGNSNISMREIMITSVS